MNMNIFNQRSKEKLTFLKDIRKDIDVYLNGEFKYFKIHLLDLQGISNFINFIDLNKICLVIPFISSSCKLDDPYLILSKQILISNYSSDLLIHDYLYNQFEKAITEITENTAYYKDGKTYIYIGRILILLSLG